VGARNSARAPIPVSDKLRRSGLLAGRNSYPLREAVLVMTVLNHPALLADHLDAFAHIEFGSADLESLRAAVVDAVAHDEGQGASVTQELAAGRFGPLLKRLEAQIEAAGYWPATPAAADADANEAWMQALTLHQRQRTLHRELRDAETALALDPSDANFARLVDIQKQLARSEGTEALIEGFGAPSGRGARAF
jgi:DNA primase